MSNNEEFQLKDKYNNVTEKPRGKIFIDNLIGGLAWGAGGIIGATIIVGVLGLIISRSRQIPLIGDVVNVVIDEINQGRNSDIFGNGNNATSNSQNSNSNQNPVSYPSN